MIEENEETLFIATCGECIYCNDTGPDPQNVGQHINNCHVKPPKAVPMGTGGGGVAVMSVRPTVKLVDLSCDLFISKLQPPH